MKNWQKERNYRRILDEDGKAIAYIITVDDIDVEVSEEVYLAYSSIDRRERYYKEALLRDRVLSLDEMADDDMKLEFVCSRTSPSCEESILAAIESNERERQLEAMRRTIRDLPDSDRELITALFVKGMGVREYARWKGVSERAIRKRRDRILNFIKNILKIFEN